MPTQPKFTTSPLQPSRIKHREALREKEKWVIDPIFPCGAVHLIGGASGVGKSTWMFQMLREWDEGKDVLGGTSYRMPWVYVSGDRNTLDTDKTLRRMGMADWDIPCFGYEEMTQDNDHSLFHVVDFFRYADLIVIEGLQAFIPDAIKQTQNKATLTWMTEMRRHVLNSGKTILATIHSPKSGYDNVRNNFLGSASLAGATSTLININPPKGSHETGINTRVREVIIGGRNFDNKYLTYEVDAGGKFVLVEGNQNKKVGDVEDQQKANEGSATFATLDTCIEVLPFGVQVPLNHFMQTANHHKISKATVYRWLIARQEQGILMKVKGGCMNDPRNNKPVSLTFYRYQGTYRYTDQILQELRSGSNVTICHLYCQSPWRVIPTLPEGVEVVHANGLLKCHICYKLLYDHPKYRYPWGEGAAVKGCDGRFYHL